MKQLDLENLSWQDMRAIKNQKKSHAARALAMIKNGFHPFGLRLREPRDKVCGDCRHANSHERVKKYYKCLLSRVSCGPATDLRLSWPACEKFESKRS